MGDQRERPAGRTVLLTLREASLETGVPYVSLRKLVLAGHIPHVTLGDSRRYWIKRKDLEALIANGTATEPGR